jgi:hypothetical protein
MSVFHGDWNEDPKEFLNSYLKCTAAGDDKFKARQFINYLGAGSDADDWFDELPQEGKKDWVAIEVSFRKRWLKEELEVFSIKEIVTTENEPQSTPTPSLVPLAASPLDFTTTTATQTETTASQDFKIGYTTFADTSQSTESFKYRKNAKFHCTSENSSKITIFSSQQPSVAIWDSLELSTTTTALKNRPPMPDFTQKHENFENSPISSQTTPKTPALNIVEPTNDTTRVYASPLTSNDAVLRPTTSFTSASSSHLPVTRDQRSALLRAVFELKPPTESPAPTAVVTVFKTRPESADFMGNCQNIENSLNFIQRPPELLISTPFKWTDKSGLSPEPTTIVTALETRSTTANFVKIYQKVEKSNILTKNHQKSPVSEPFNWARNTESLLAQYIPPTKHPCTLSVSFHQFLFFNIHHLVLSVVLILLSFDHNFHFQFSFIIFSWPTIFRGDEDVAMLEGGTWSSGLGPLSSLHMTCQVAYHVIVP